MYKKEIALGASRAMHEMGEMYEKGQCVRQDRKVAKEWFGKSCDAGFQNACGNYRRLNEAGF